MKKILPFIAALAIGIPAMAQNTQSDTVAAQFPGGEKALDSYIAKNLKYPQVSINNGIEGVVHLKFLVKTDGSLNNITIVRLVDPDLESEAVRLVKGMPAWTPATVEGKPIDSESNLKITFSLPD